jgi:hypothetical protein
MCALVLIVAGFCDVQVRNSCASSVFSYLDIRRANRKHEMTAIAFRMTTLELYSIFQAILNCTTRFGKQLSRRID